MIKLASVYHLTGEEERPKINTFKLDEEEKTVSASVRNETCDEIFHPCARRFGNI